MSSLVRGVFIVGAKRTAFGTFGGSLKDVDAIELGRLAAVAAIEQAKISPDAIDSVIVGCVNQATNKAGPYTARHVGLKAGVSIKTPCLTVNRLCGSGFQAIVTGSQEILLDDAEIVLCGSTESMSQAPFIQRNSRFGVRFSKAPDMECSLWTTLTDEHCKTPMGITAENLAKKYKLTRQEVDEFALLSQTRWRQAQEAGRFKEEIVPVTLKVRNKETVFEVDEHPQQTSMESLSKLRPSFDKDGVCTAGNSSGIGDGGAAVIVASEEAVRNHNLKPLARIVGYAVVGCEPTIMGIGPVDAIKKVCDANGLNLANDIDLVDVNEAFSSQFLSVAKELSLDIKKTNVNGGAIALAHPVGASGGRITANLTYELIKRKAKYGIGAACIGGGQGIALLIENMCINK